MKILAIDTSGLVASVAVVSDGLLIAEYTVNYKITHSQTLLPMLDEIKKMIELDLNSIDAVAISNGPGSFTGLRIGVATAKGLGLALDKPIVEVPTVEALAYNMYGSGLDVVPIMDARREEVYTGIYRFERSGGGRFDYDFIEVMPQSAIPLKQLIDVINSNGRPVVFTGDADIVYDKLITESINVDYTFAPFTCNRQRAAAVALLGTKYYNEGKTCSADICSPEYLRLSQAERERMEREQKK